jgi:hypothetical protein
VSFQGKEPFFTFLKGVATGAVLEEAAPAENYILDERLSDERQNEFLTMSGFTARTPASPSEWFQNHKTYTVSRVAQAAVSTTFCRENSRAWLPLEPNWDVVRIETLDGLCRRAGATALTPDNAQILIQELLDARSAGRTLDPLNLARLQKWLNKINSASDRRPAFVASFMEVEPLLARPDWANRLRDALGLGSIRPIGGQPIRVLLMQYNLERVYHAHLGKSPAWAASPTVLDDVPTAGPNPCFFPAPVSASQGYGFTVDLDLTDTSWKREFLHAHITYTLDDIRRLGEVTSDVSPQQIESARKLHRGLLKPDLRHINDVPARP